MKRKRFLERLTINQLFIYRDGLGLLIMAGGLFRFNTSKEMHVAIAARIYESMEIYQDYRDITFIVAIHRF